MQLLKPIVLVEDNPRDLELTLIALEEARLVNEVVTLRDGAEAIDYLACKGAEGESGSHSAGHQAPQKERARGAAMDSHRTGFEERSRRHPYQFQRGTGRHAQL